MEKKKGAEDDFLAGLDDTKDTDNLGLNTGTDELFPEETVEKKEVLEDKDEDDNIPFYKLAKNPKFLKFVEKQVEKKTKDFKPSAEQTFRQEVSVGDSDLVSAFTAIIGNDTEDKRNALKALENSLAKVDERATQKAIAQLQKVQEDEKQREANEIEEAESELEEGFEEIETSFGVDITSGSPQANRLQNAYREFLQSIEPKGGYQEYPDFSRTFELFKNSVQKQRSNATAKTLASRGMERSTASNLEKPKGTSWADVDKMLNTN